MDNPFESGHIKNYILLYASIVVIMVLFFIASSLFHDVEDVEKKLFSAEEEVLVPQVSEENTQEAKSVFQLLEVDTKSYKVEKR